MSCLFEKELWQCLFWGVGVLKKKNLFQGKVFNFVCVGVTLNSLQGWGMADWRVFCNLAVQRRQWLL